MKLKRDMKAIIITVFISISLLLSITLIATSNIGIKSKKKNDKMKDIENLLKSLKSDDVNEKEVLEKLKNTIKELESEKQKNNQELLNPFYSNNNDPFEDFNKMEKYIDQLFQQSMSFSTSRINMNFPNLGFKMNSNLSLNRDIDINTEETDKYFLVKVNIPNIKNNNLKVELKDNLLTISGTITKVEEKKDNKGNIVYQQEYSSNFTRSLSIPVPVKDSGMSTEFKNNILEIKILKKL